LKDYSRDEYSCDNRIDRPSGRTNFRPRKKHVHNKSHAQLVSEFEIDEAIFSADPNYIPPMNRLFNMDSVKCSDRQFFTAYNYIYPGANSCFRDSTFAYSQPWKYLEAGLERQDRKMAKHVKSKKFLTRETVEDSMGFPTRRVFSGDRMTEHLCCTRGKTTLDNLRELYLKGGLPSTLHSELYLKGGLPTTLRSG